jgi:hypothetical protein
MSAFMKNTSFPQNKCSLTDGGRVWKMDVREWAFAQVEVQDVDPDVDITSNNPSVVAGIGDKGDKGLKITRNWGARSLTARFYALAPGFTFVYMFKGDASKPLGDMLQVQVLLRQASKDAQIARARLDGSSFAMNSVDLPAFYQMDGTTTIDPTITDAAHLFDSVPAGIGENNDFCTKAATAAGCTVVAPARALTKTHSPKFLVDLVDRSAAPKVFTPGLITPADFCAHQDSFRFVVPV